ncbi:MAG: glutamine synthetase family protein, partial [Actinobacteria bacterium]|nr:glutamine synthetase family protein [Actinomycetota bacterium]
MRNDLADIRRELDTQGIDILRLIWPDVLGLTRSKDITVSQLERAAGHGPTFCQATWVTTTRGDVLDGHGSLQDGLSDMVSRLDANTIRPIPWVPGVAVGIADIDEPDGSPNMISPRTLLRRVISEYKLLGLIPIVGPELEFYLAQQGENGWERIINKTGRVYTTGSAVDPDGTFLHLLRMIDQLSIGAFAGNHEFCPSQYEINLWHGEALDAADRCFLLKNAVKDISASRGVLGTFIGKPWADEGGSGFHVHLSVTDIEGDQMMDETDGELSTITRRMIAGILEHAPALVAFCNPTINAYKRLGPDTMAPYRSNWGYDNRTTFVRIPPERGPGARIEVRIGDGAANPYVVIAVILAAALDGLSRQLECPPASEGWTYEDESRPALPMTFADALDAMKADTYLTGILGEPFVSAYETLKRDEIRRYEEAVEDPSTREITQWELD